MHQYLGPPIYGAGVASSRFFFQVEVQEAEEVETVEAEEAVQEDEDDEDVEGMPEDEMPEDEMPEDEEDVPFEEARDVDMGSGMIVNSIKKSLVMPNS